MPHQMILLHQATQKPPRQVLWLTLLLMMMRYQTMSRQKFPRQILFFVTMPYQTLSPQKFPYQTLLHLTIPH
ncbi:hypothetical protein F5B17DRAFT_383139 [Nemania serpens]|nr:hypothetical protein F5B17DRAFT_383139 [Nemania serpens]